jgi:mono/diheme cytochrome c family protein
MRRLAAMALLLAGIVACHRDMRDQPRYETLEASALFANRQSARPIPQGTVARGQLSADEVVSTGKQEGRFVAQIPVALDEALVSRGQERFNIYCSPCHGRTGSGDGMIVRRGFRQPPSFHLQRLRDASAGHFFDVMTHGFGAMPRYGGHIAPRDRWAIVAYIRALQLSQNAELEDVPAAERSKLSEATP